MSLIRLVEEADLEAVHRIDSNIFGSEAYPFSFFRQAYELYPETFLVACDDNQVIGYCLGAVALRKKNTGWILSLAVLANYQRQGYGSKLLLKALEALRGTGCDEVLLSVQPDNDLAKALFRKFGFKTVTIHAEYFGPGHAREIMRVLL